MTILEALSVAFSFTGQNMPDAALAEMAVELEQYPKADVMLALKRCRSELKSIKYSDILDRLPFQHPGVEQAWGIVSKVLNNEYISIAWTNEMRQAFDVAAALSDDKVAARMAFKEKYVELVSNARATGRTPTWAVSLGHDPTLRDEAIKDAESKNLISQSYAAKLLAHDPPKHEAQRLIEEDMP